MAGVVFVVLPFGAGATVSTLVYGGLTTFAGTGSVVTMLGIFGAACVTAGVYRSSFEPTGKGQGPAFEKAMAYSFISGLALGPLAYQVVNGYVFVVRWVGRRAWELVTTGLGGLVAPARAAPARDD